MFKFDREKFCKEYQCEVGGRAERLLLVRRMNHATFEKVLHNDMFDYDTQNDAAFMSRYAKEINNTLRSFLDGDLAVRCRTKEERHKLLNILAMKEVHWNTGALANQIGWDDYLENEEIFAMRKGYLVHGAKVYTAEYIEELRCDFDKFEIPAQYRILSMSFEEFLKNFDFKFEKNGIWISLRVCPSNDKYKVNVDEEISFALIGTADSQEETEEKLKNMTRTAYETFIERARKDIENKVV